MVYLTNFNEGKQKEDIKKSGDIINDTYRIYYYMWNINKKKKEFGRVPFVASRKLGLSPYKTNKVLTSQVNKCNMNCWFCYVDDKNKDASRGINKPVNQVLNEVVTYLNENEDVNALRISGGEPTLFPQFLYKIIREFPHEYGLNIDTNLTRKLHKEELINQSNVQFQMCIKGISEKNFEENTGLPGKIWYKQLENLEYMEDVLDDYSIYLIDLIQDEKDLLDLEDLFDVVIQRPEKVNILQISLYSPTYTRLNGNEPPEFKPKTLENAWKKLLKQRTGKDYLKCLILH